MSLREDRLLRIMELREEGRSESSIAQELGIPEQMVRRYEQTAKQAVEDASAAGITLPHCRRGRARKDRPELDTLIRQGLSQQEIAEAQHPEITRQRVHQYLCNSGQHSYWKGKRRERKLLYNKRRLRQHFLFLLEERITQLAEEKDWAYEKAWQYVRQRRWMPNNIPFKTLVQFYDNYHYAKTRGVKLSLQELAEGSGFNTPGEARYYLRAVGEEALYRTIKRTFWRLPDEKKQAMDRAFTSPFNAGDIAYFLGIKGRNTLLHFKSRKRRAPKFITMIGSKEFRRGAEGVVTYRLASQIYEAEDAGFHLAEIAYALPVKPRILQYALEHRGEIEPAIINTLQRMFPEKEIHKPYLKR